MYSLASKRKKGGGKKKREERGRRSYPYTALAWGKKKKGGRKGLTFRKGKGGGRADTTWISSKNERKENRKRREND